MKTIKLLALLLVVGVFTSCNETVAGVEEEICVEDTCYEIIARRLERSQGHCWTCWRYETIYYVKGTCTGELLYFKTPFRVDIGEKGGVYCGFDDGTWRKTYFDN